MTCARGGRKLSFVFVQFQERRKVYICSSTKVIDMSLHTVLGANGTIAKELVPVLIANNEKVRLVSRSPKPVNGAETRKADVLNLNELRAALEGSTVVYLVIGIQYDHK